ITTTPRRRIVIRRALKKLELAGDVSNYKKLLSQFQYDVLDTCAVDGLCANACPVDINTGDLVKRLRSENHSSFQNALALMVAKKFAVAEFFIRAGINLKFNRLIGSSPLMKYIRSAPPVKRIKKDHANVIYFPSCVTRIMGAGIKGKKNLMETFIR